MKIFLILVNQRLADLEHDFEQLSTLRSELRPLVAEWDDRLARTAQGRPAHLLETLAGLPAIERARALGTRLKGHRRFRPASGRR